MKYYTRCLSITCRPDTMKNRGLEKMHTPTEQKRLSHAYIIASPSEKTRNERAQKLAASMVCANGGAEPCGSCRDCRKALAGIHPDVIEIERPKDDKGRPRREIYVEQIRELVMDAGILPNEAEKKVYVIKDAGFMNSGAQNALLKVLEEPPAHVKFILCAENALLLMDTVRSRCIAEEYNADTEMQSEDMLKEALQYLELASKGDRAGLLRFCAAEEKMQQTQALEFTLCVEKLIADALSKRIPEIGISRADFIRIERLIALSRDYLNANVSVKHVFGMLAAETLLIEMRKTN